MNMNSTNYFCKRCNKETPSNRKDKKFCSDKCRKDNWEEFNPRISIPEINDGKIFLKGEEVGYYRQRCKYGLEQLMGKCIYMLMRDQECLYVGLSCAGIFRPISKGHKIAKHIQDQDDLIIIYLPDELTWNEISVLEATLTHILKPKLNEADKSYEFERIWKEYKGEKEDFSKYIIWETRKEYSK